MQKIVNKMKFWPTVGWIYQMKTETETKRVKHNEFVIAKCFHFLEVFCVFHLLKFLNSFLIIDLIGIHTLLRDSASAHGNILQFFIHFFWALK